MNEANEPRSEEERLAMTGFVAPPTSESAAYIERRLERSSKVSSPEEVQEVLQRLETPLLDFEYGDERTVEVKADEFSYAVSYEKVADEGDFKKIDGFVNYFVNENDVSADRESLKMHLDRDLVLWARLTDLNIKSPVRDEAIKINSIMPEQYDIFFSPSNRQLVAAISENDKAIYVAGGEITAPEFVLTLLHEIGHAWDHKNLKENKVSPLPQTDGTDVAEIARGEAAANAFGLRSVNSFVTDPDSQLRRDAEVYFHESMQASCVYLKKELEGPNDDTEKVYTNKPA